MIHELRVYHCVPGRLPALLSRFENVTLALWERHGIRQAGFWTVLVGESNQVLSRPESLYPSLLWVIIRDTPKPLLYPDERST